MGRDVENYIIMKSDKVDLNKLLQDYLNSILDIDDEDPNYMMIYGDDLGETSMVDFLEKDKFKEVRGRQYYFDRDIIIFYAFTRKCDLVETFGEFIKPHLKYLECCKLFIHDGEASERLYERDFIEDLSYFYYDSNLLDSFYFDKYGQEQFMFDRCGLCVKMKDSRC